MFPNEGESQIATKIWNMYTTRNGPIFTQSRDLTRLVRFQSTVEASELLDKNGVGNLLTLFERILYIETGVSNLGGGQRFISCLEVFKNTALKIGIDYTDKVNDRHYY